MYKNLPDGTPVEIQGCGRELLCLQAKLNAEFADQSEMALPAGTSLTEHARLRKVRNARCMTMTHPFRYGTSQQLRDTACEHLVSNLDEQSPRSRQAWRDLGKGAPCTVSDRDRRSCALLARTDCHRLVDPHLLRRFHRPCRSMREALEVSCVA